MICKLKLHSKGFYLQILGSVTVPKFLQMLALDFPCICLQFLPGNFSRQEDNFLQTNVYKILKSGSSACSCICRPQIFSSRIVRSEALVYNSHFF